MGKTYITGLGDRWEQDDQYVKSLQTGQHFGLSVDMKRLLEGAEAAPGANPDVVARMSSRVRNIEEAPMAPDGHSFLIPDRTLGGRWSHPVKFADPQFDWNERAAKVGTLMLLSKDPEIGIQSYVGNAQMNEQNPGTGDDVFNVVVWDAEEEDYGIAYPCESFAHAEEYVLKGDIQKKLRAQAPLPWLGYECASFVNIPQGETMGYRGMYAEVQLKSVVTDNFRVQHCDVHLMDQHGRCVAAGESSINGLFELRDNPWKLKGFIEEHAFKDEKGLLHNFRNSEIFEPADHAELRAGINDLSPGKFLKFQTPGDDYQLLISYDLVDTYRDNNSGKRLHTGPGSPSEETLRDSKAIRVTIGTERSYTVVVKHAEGAMTRTLSNVILNSESLFKMISDENAVIEMVEGRRAKPVAFAENLKTGDAACFHQLLGASLQGRVFDIQYATSRSVKAQDLLNEMEAAKRPRVEESLSMC